MDLLERDYDKLKILGKTHKAAGLEHRKHRAGCAWGGHVDKIYMLCVDPMKPAALYSISRSSLLRFEQPSERLYLPCAEVSRCSLENELGGCMQCGGRE